MRALRDERRGEDRRVSGRLQVQAVVEQLLLEQMAARARCARRMHLDRGEHAVTAQVGDRRQILERPDAVEEVRRERGAALEEPFLAVDVQRCKPRRARRRVARIGVTVEELDRTVLRRGDDRIVNALADRDRAHRLRAVGEPLGHGHDVGRDAETLRGESLAGPAETADHFIEHEQDAVLVADLAHALEIAFWRHQAAGRPGDRLDETGGDILRAVESDEALQIVGQLRTMSAFAACEEVLLEMGMAHVRDPGQRRSELAPVVDDAGKCHAAEVDAVVRTLARYEAVATALATRLMVSQGHFHRRVDRFGAGVDEKDAVQITGRQLRHARRKLELLRMPAQERCDEVELEELPVHRVGDLLAAVPGVDAEHPRRSVDELLAAVVPVIHALRAHDHLRIGFEVAIGRERHPVLVERDLAGLRLVAQGEFGVVHRDLLAWARGAGVHCSATQQCTCNPNRLARPEPVRLAGLGQARVADREMRQRGLRTEGVCRQPHAAA